MSTACNRDHPQLIQGAKARFAGAGQLSARQRMDRTTLWALALLIVVILASLLGVKSHVGTIAPAAVAKKASAADEQAIVLGNQTMFVEPGTVGSKIVGWLNAGTTSSNAFFVSDQVFAAGSDALTPEASARLQRLIRVVKARGDVDARLFVTTYEGADAARKRELAVRRSQRIRAEMIAGGVPVSRITTAVTPLSPRAAQGDGPRPTIVIVLSKRKT